MKTKLLFFLLLGSLGMSAQTTHHVNWFPGVQPSETTMTIDQGDIVMWMWTSPHPHSVTSAAGSTETFDSGILTGVGQSFSHTFTEVGTNPYVCEVHPGMIGTITVEAIMGVKDDNRISFDYYPNPVTDILTINAQETISNIKVYDMNGRLIMDAAGGNLTSKIYMANYNAGTYLVKVAAGGATKTINVVKK